MVVEVAHFQKRSSRVLRELLLTMGSQINENSLKQILKSPQFLVFLQTRYRKFQFAKFSYIYQILQGRKSKS